MSDSGSVGFSRRHGYGKAGEITVREDAPWDLRASLVQTLRNESGLTANTARSAATRVLRTVPNPNNWSDGPVWGEVEDLIFKCPWYRVYDLIEVFELLEEPGKREQFRSAINEVFEEQGIGWKLVDGRVEARGDEGFESTFGVALESLDHAKLPTARSEMQEALNDLSGRPEPDLTGAVHHAMGATECVAREVSGDPKSTLGEVLKKHPNLLPKPLNDVISKTWGYASNVARHIEEGGTVSRDEAELVVGLAASVVTYMARKGAAQPQEQAPDETP